MRKLDRVSNPIFGVLLKPALIHTAREIRAGDEDITALNLLETLLRVLKKGDAYVEKRISKKRGGYRLIQKPYEELKTIQRCILHGLLKRRYRPTTICHSFISGRFQTLESGLEVWLPGRSIVSNAKAHMGAPPQDTRKSPVWRQPKSLFGVDLKDAYPSVSSERVFEIYQKIMGDPWTAQILTWLTTHEGCLPQGAPTSPILFNMACRGLDAALWENFSKEPFYITRYADDIALTSLEKEISARSKEKLVRLCNQYGFVVNRDKDCYWRDYQHALRVTGVNLFPEERRLGLPKPVMEKFRAILFHSVRVLEQMGKESRNMPADFFSAERNRLVGRIRGIAGFAGMIYASQPKRLWDWNPGGWNRIKEMLFAIQGPQAAAWFTRAATKTNTASAPPEQLWLPDEMFDKYFRDAINMAADY